MCTTQSPRWLPERPGGKKPAIAKGSSRIEDDQIKITGQSTMLKTVIENQQFRAQGLDREAAAYERRA